MQADSQIYAALSKPQPRSLTATAISRQPYDPKTNVEKQSATICNPHIVAGLAKIFSTKVSKQIQLCIDTAEYSSRSF